MLKKRLIARLDIKSPNLIKPVRMEGVRVVGDPNEYAVKYNEQGIDEILYMDVVASLYGRNALSDLVKKTTENVFCPITVGGGIRSIEDATRLLRCGADKIAVNTAAIKRPELITELAEKFGSQCVVAQIDVKKVKRKGFTDYQVWCDGGREKTDLHIQQWAATLEALGAGELLLTSIDQQGTQKGFELELLYWVSTQIKIPIVLSGGMGQTVHAMMAFKQGADGVAIARFFHHDKNAIWRTKNALKDAGYPVREAA